RETRSECAKRELRLPLKGICRELNREQCPVQVGVRTGDTPAHERRVLHNHPPHILISTPESLSLLLSQRGWLPLWRGVNHIIVDEVHSFAPTKRGADLTVSLERLASACSCDPVRIGLSALAPDPPSTARE